MRDKVDPTEVCIFLPYIRKEIPKKVEKDFIVLLASAAIASNSDALLFNILKKL